MNTDTPETNAELLKILMDRGVVDHRNAPENLVSKSRQLERERDRYKIALEGIAGFPHQYFDGETPWRMRKLAEHALSLENANVDLPDTAAQDSTSKPNNPAVSG